MASIGDSCLMLMDLKCHPRCPLQLLIGRAANSQTPRLSVRSEIGACERMVGSA